ncbi:MAG: hypothetical protein AAFX89_05185, partial [Pseudomonadota bacterium]
LPAALRSEPQQSRPWRRSQQQEDGNLGAALKKLESQVLRGDVVKNGKRIDGRALDTIRPIVSETGILPRTHGSALFTRGETQGLVVTTLGTGDDEQMIDALTGMYKSNFTLHQGCHLPAALRSEPQQSRPWRRSQQLYALACR